MGDAELDKIRQQRLSQMQSQFVSYTKMNFIFDNFYVVDFIFLFLLFKKVKTKISF